jgi:hypothetical protein
MMSEEVCDSGLEDEIEIVGNIILTYTGVVKTTAGSHESRKLAGFE